MIQLSQAQIERSGICRLAAQHFNDQTDQAIIIYLFGASQHWGVPYCYPSYKTIRADIFEWFGIDICDSTLYHRLKRLEALGFIVRVIRRKRGKDGSFKFTSTLYKLAGELARLWHQLKRLGRKLRPILRLGFFTDNLSPGGRRSHWGDGLPQGEKLPKDLKGGPRGNISSESPPRWDLERLRQVIKALP